MPYKVSCDHILLISNLRVIAIKCVFANEYQSKCQRAVKHKRGGPGKHQAIEKQPCGKQFMIYLILI